MKSASKPQNETQRLESLRALNILDTLPERDFDQITFLASQICGTPIALISLIDQNRQWFKSKVGLAASETPRDMAFCAHAILGDEVLVVPDSSKDERFFDNPLVTGAPYVKFYAGVPLKTPDGIEIGTVCVIDSKPRVLSSQQIDSLRMLSEQVTRLLQLRNEIATLKQTQDKLQFKTVAFDLIFEGVVIQDETGSIIDFNPSAPSVLNLNADQLLGKTSFDPSWQAIKEDGSDFPGEEHPGMVCLRTGQPQRNVVMGVRSLESNVRWIKINSAPIFQNHETMPTHAVTSFVDISEELLAKRIIEQKRSNLRFILDGVPSLIGLWGADEINLNSNAAYSDYFQRNPEEIFGIHMKELFGEELYEKNSPFIKRVLAGETVTFERVLQHKDGSPRHTLATYIPNFEGEKVVNFLCVVSDVTELKNIESAKRKLEAQIVESARFAALGEMAAGVAHEINNPLAIIKGKSVILIRKANQKKLDWDSGVKQLKIIENTADRIAKIVKALKTYSRNADDDPFDKANVSEIIAETLELCFERFKKAGVEVRQNCESDLEVSSRSAQISQVLMNLLGNSFDAVSILQNKWIELKGFKKDGMVQIQVTDSGSGIIKTVVEKMMNPFFTTKEVGKGTGLGLSISKGIIESHGGSLEYIDGATNTTFLIVLPEYSQASLGKIA